MNNASELVTAMLAIAYAALMSVAGQLYLESKSTNFSPISVKSVPQLEQRISAVHPL
jgi:hypothetical protein